MPRFAYQTVRGADGQGAFFCSVHCRMGPQPLPVDGGQQTCDACGTAFRVQYALQTVDGRRGRRHACSEPCRVRLLVDEAATDDADVGPRVIAVLNQKGGTAKTTTAVTVAAGIAETGARVLLVDADAQGSVAVSLGIRAARGLYHVLVDGADPASVAVLARPNLSVVTADRALATAEQALATTTDPWRVMARSFRGLAGRFDFVLIDCAPSVSLIGHNALAYAQELIVPVSCDYLALVGVKQVLRTVRHVNESLAHPVRVLGVLPTFFDVRNRICHRSREALSRYFQDRVMPSIRVSTAFKEAPSIGRTIFEHAPNGRGATDYRAVVDWVLATPPSVLAAVDPPARFGFDLGGLMAHNASS